MAYLVSNLKLVPLMDSTNKVQAARKIKEVFELENRGIYVLTFEGTNIAMELPYTKAAELCEQQIELAKLPEIK